MCDAIFAAARQRESRPIVTSRYPSRTCPSAYITSYQPRRSNDLVSWEMQRVRGKLMCHALCHALRINCTGKNLAHGDQRIGKVSFNTPNPNLGLRGPSAQRKKNKKIHRRRLTDDRNSCATLAHSDRIPDYCTGVSLRMPCPPRGDRNCNYAPNTISSATTL